MRIWRIVLLPVLLAVLSTSMAPAQAEVAPKRVLVELRKQGGFAGLNDRVIVFGNGCARLSRRTGPTVDKCLTAKEERRLRGHLRHLKIGRSQRAPQGADFIRFTLAHDKRRAGVYDLPPTWQPVVRDLDKLMEKYWAPD
ncbi:hypothetical protein HD597_010674 [Nonomuraea thailandensis]|uniref:Uncharacterized protein n=1 Tax=Nonomuraea thailandensis TaxID=1188745 RepID=A0A9X2K8L0_9ACTN|nr:hypothetical protein [Nonomuraea thailandensis]MCP2363654.1 hypothetical protein [Nonomuraea thailandensis]